VDSTRIAKIETDNEILLGVFHFAFVKVPQSHDPEDVEKLPLRLIEARYLVPCCPWNIERSAEGQFLIRKHDGSTIDRIKNLKKSVEAPCIGRWIDKHGSIVLGPSYCHPSNSTRRGTPKISDKEIEPYCVIAGLDMKSHHAFLARNITKREFKVDPRSTVFNRCFFGEGVGNLRLLNGGAVKVQRAADEKNRPYASACGEDAQDRHDPLCVSVLPRVELADGGYNLCDIALLGLL
jgi:hypothetical protein